MLDAHVHLDFMANAEEVARRGSASGMSFYACTVTPEGYLAARERFKPFANVTVGLGLHPWWIGGGPAEDGKAAPPDATDEQVDELIAHLPEAELVGEVGLDFGKRHVGTKEQQVRAFARIARACAQCGGKTLSIHSVNAAREAIDLLEDAGTFETCTCLFHWYTGPSDQLKRAIQAGARFSVGIRMLNTRKGREYVKAIPRNRLLAETDAPAERGQTCSIAALQAELESVFAAIDAIKSGK